MKFRVLDTVDVSRVAAILRLNKYPSNVGRLIINTPVNGKVDILEVVE